MQTAPKIIRIMDCETEQFNIKSTHKSSEKGLNPSRARLHLERKRPLRDKLHIEVEQLSQAGSWIIIEKNEEAGFWKNSNSM